jgi:hypothetical protein
MHYLELRVNIPSIVEVDQHSLLEVVAHCAAAAACSDFSHPERYMLAAGQLARSYSISRNGLPTKYFGSQTSVADHLAYAVEGAVVPTTDVESDCCNH